MDSKAYKCLRRKLDHGLVRKKGQVYFQAGVTEKERRMHHSPKIVSNIEDMIV